MTDHVSRAAVLAAIKALHDADASRVAKTAYGLAHAAINALPPAAQPTSEGEDDDLRHVPIVGRIVRAALERDTKTLREYVAFLCDKLDEDGREVSARAFRSMLDGKMGAVVKPAAPALDVEAAARMLQHQMEMADRDESPWTYESAASAILAAATRTK
jgi:hypothetical protein